MDCTCVLAATDAEGNSHYELRCSPSPTCFPEATTPARGATTETSKTTPGIYFIVIAG